MIKKLIPFLLAIFFITPAFSIQDAWDICSERIIQNKTFSKAVTNMIKNDRENAGEIIESKANDIRLLLLANMFADDTGLCKQEIVDIAKMDTLQLAFDIDGTEYEFNIDVSTLFDYFQTQTTIMVYNNRIGKTWDPIKNDDIKNLYWSDACSDHTIADNLDDDATVNIAGQKIFTEFGGTKNEFFLDFEQGNNQRAFPGIVIEDETNYTEEKIVVFTHLPTAIKKAEEFAKNLQNSNCGNQGLAVYLVSLAGNQHDENSTEEEEEEDENSTEELVDNNPNNIKLSENINTNDSGSGKTGSIIMGTGVGIGTIIVGGSTITGISILGAASYSIAGWLITAGLSAEAVPVVGWIVGTAAVIVGGAIMLAPADIADIEQVYILDGPHLVR